MSLSLQMSKTDWRLLFKYMEAANDLKFYIEKATAAGKQQVSVKQEAVERFLALKPPPDFWIKLGNLIGSELSKDGNNGD